MAALVLGHLGEFGLEAAVLHFFSEGDADHAGDAAETEEEGVAAGGGEAGATAHVNEDVGAPAEELPPKAEKLGEVAGAVVVAEVAVDEAGAVEDRGRGRGFGVGGEAGEEATFGLWKGSLDEVKGRQGNDSVSEAAEAVEQNLPWRTRGSGFGHRTSLLVCRA